MILSAGICPFDQNIFSDDEVLCSFVSDRHGLQFENPLSALKQENNFLLKFIVRILPNVVKKNRKCVNT